MARPPIAKDDEQTRQFVVSNGHAMIDFDGIRCEAGDTIMLTKEQAAYYQKRGSVHVDMEDIFDAEPKTDTAEVGSGAQTDGQGDAGDATAARQAAEKARRAPPTL